MALFAPVFLPLEPFRKRGKEVEPPRWEADVASSPEEWRFDDSESEDDGIRQPDVEVKHHSCSYTNRNRIYFFCILYDLCLYLSLFICWLHVFVTSIRGTSNEDHLQINE